jgi:hypothetical protein
MLTTQHPKAKVASLNSWKEISLYLDRGIRTVQRWERELGLPVHRVGRGPRSPVHAFPSELHAWLLRVSRKSNELAGHDGNLGSLMHPDGVAAASRVLVNRSSDLVQRMVRSIWVQRQRTEELMAAIEDIRRRVRGHMANQSAELREWKMRRAELQAPANDGRGPHPQARKRTKP